MDTRVLISTFTQIVRNPESDIGDVTALFLEMLRIILEMIGPNPSKALSLLDVILQNENNLKTFYSNKDNCKLLREKAGLL